MPPTSRQLGDYQDFRVFIRDREGHYLAQGMQGWYFTDDRSRAAVFHYFSDRVAEQLERIGSVQGVHLKEEPVPLHEIYEICDRCKEMAIPFISILPFEAVSQTVPATIPR